MPHELRQTTQDLDEKAHKVEKREDAAVAIREFDEIIQTKIKNIIWITYNQGEIYQKFKENKKFVPWSEALMSIYIFKISIVKLINKYPKLKNSSV